VIKQLRQRRRVIRRKGTLWAISGLFVAAIMVAVLGFSSVGTTSQKAKQTVDSQTEKAEVDNNQYQTTRVFWPIWNGKR
jgi:type VI protein secretion system component VasF